MDDEYTARFGHGIWRDCARALTRDLQDGREKSLVLTKLEEAQMWAHRAVRAQEASRVQSERVVHDDYGTAHSDSC